MDVGLDVRMLSTAVGMGIDDLGFDAGLSQLSDQHQPMRARDITRDRKWLRPKM